MTITTFNTLQPVSKASSAKAISNYFSIENPAQQTSSSPSTTVSISSAAKQLAAGNPYATIPGITQDTINEAQDVVANLHVVQNPYGAGVRTTDMGFSGLPLLPQNEALLNQLVAEQQKYNIHAHDANDVNGWSNIQQQINALGEIGWQKPLTMSDINKQVALDNAIHVTLSNLPIARTGRLPTAAEVDELIRNANNTGVSDMTARWQSEGLTMPPLSASDVGQSSSTWLLLAGKAGISEDEFMSKIRSVAASNPPSQISGIMEKFISDAYSNKTSKSY